MANLLYLLAAIAATVLICSVLYVRTVRGRRPNTVEAGIDSFQRELKALSPERRANEREGRRSG